MILVTTGKIPNAAELSEVHGRPWDDVDVSEALGVKWWNFALNSSLRYSIKIRNFLIMLSMAGNQKNMNIENFGFGPLSLHIASICVLIAHRKRLFKPA